MDSTNKLDDNKDPQIVNTVFREGEKKSLDPERVSKWLRLFESNRANLCMEKSPFLPKGGQVFVYKSSGESDYDYRCDGYNVWCQNGNCYKKTDKYDVFKTYHVIKGQDGQGSKQDGMDEQQKNKRAEKTQLVGFTKEIWQRKKPNKSGPNFIVIHYIGNEKLWKPTAHGNSKTEKVYTRNTTAVKEKLKQTFQQGSMNPKEVYIKVNKSISAENENVPEREPVDSIRDAKQARNIKSSVEKQKKLMRCDIFSVIEMGRSEELGDFIVKHVVNPYEAVILAEKQVLKLANHLLNKASLDPEIPQLMTYDTTFELTDGYVSALIMRNTDLVGDPIFAAAFLVHERKFQEVHKEFFTIMKDVLRLDLLEVNIPICTDREKGISAALLSVLPKTNLVFCWNHILQDIEVWIERAGGKFDDVNVLKKHYEVLLLSETEESFDESYAMYEEMWSQSFKEYSERFLREDVKNRASICFTKQFQAFSDKTPTNNLSESMNHVIKQQTNWKILRYDSCVLALFNTQLNSLSEFNKAYSEFGLGAHVLKNQFRKSKAPFTVPPYASWTEEKFISCFRNEVYKPDENIEKEGDYQQSNRARAKLTCEKNLVSLDSKTQSYTVIGLYNGQRYLLERGKNGVYSCTCSSTGFCYHRMAIFYANGLDLPDDTYQYSLSVLRKNTRDFKGRTGKKQPKPGDYVMNVTEAADSDLAVIKSMTADLSPLDTDDNDCLSLEVNKRKKKLSKPIATTPQQKKKQVMLRKNVVKIEKRVIKKRTLSNPGKARATLAESNPAEENWHQNTEESNFKDKEAKIESVRTKKADLTNEEKPSKNVASKPIAENPQEISKEGNITAKLAKTETLGTSKMCFSKDEKPSKDFIDFVELSSDEAEEGARHFYRYDPESSGYEQEQKGRISRPISAASFISDASVNEPIAPTFDWDKFDPGTVKKTWFTSSNYKSLQPCSYINSDIINDMICGIIIAYEKQEQISLVNSLEIESCLKEEFSSQIFRLAARIEGLNSDITLIPMFVHAGKHYMLGVILWARKEVVILNSLNGIPDNYGPFFQGILKFIVASFMVARIKFVRNQWRFIVASDAMRQPNGYDCGILVVFHAYRIVRKERFPYTRFPENLSDRARAWVLSCLWNFPGNDRVLRGGRIPKRVSPKDITDFIPVAEATTAVGVLYTQGDKNMDIIEENRGNSRNWTICSALICKQDEEGQWFQIFCVYCRQWYHGECIGVNENTADYFLCNNCVCHREGSDQNEQAV